MLAALVVLLVISIGVMALLSALLDRPAKDAAEQLQQQAALLDHELAHAAQFAQASARVLELAKFGDEQFRLGIVAQNLETDPLIFGSAIAFLPEHTPPGAVKAPYAYRSGNKVLTLDLAASYDFTQTSQWFIEPIRLRQPGWSAPYFDDGGGNVWMITYSVPLFAQNDTVFGVVTVDVELNSLVNQLKGGSAQLFDRSGRLLTDSGTELKGPRQQLHNAMVFLRWHNQNDDSSLLLHWLIPLGLIALVVVVGWLYIKRLTRPLYTVIRGVSNLIDGLPANQVEPAGPPELKLLGTGFNRFLSGASLSSSSVMAEELLSHLPVASYRIDSQNELHYVAPSVREFLGVKAEELLESQRGFTDFIHPEDAGEVAEKLGHAIEKHQAYALEYRLIQRNGKTLWVADRGEPFFDAQGVYLGRDGVVYDISDKRQARERLKRREQALTTLFQVVPTGLASLDEDFKVVEANQALCNLLSLRHEQLRGALLGSFFRQQDRSHIVSLCNKGEDFDWEGYLVGSGGDICWVSLALRRLADNRSVAVITDLDERRNMERAVEEAKIAADEASKAKSDFLANMSHEIRTPMNAIIGFAHLARERSNNPYLAKIEQASGTLLRILNDILDFSKIEAGKMSVEKVAFNLDDTLLNLRDIFADKAAEKKVELVFNLMPSCPNQLFGDPHRLTQILMNLISNAMKFTEKGEVVVSVQYPVAAGEEYLQLSVRDTGIGMSADQVEKLFSAFTQADSSTTRRFGGTGLGLAISQRLCQLMGGKIEVRSELGRGSIFTFTLPLVPEGEQHKPLMLAELEGKSVLIVDDNETQLAVFEGLMRAFGFKVHTLTSGQQAMDRLRNAKAMPDLMMVDWQMPGMDGLTLIGKIREQPRQPGAIMMISAFTDDELIANAKSLGVEQVLLKPVSPSHLFEYVCLCLGTHEGHLPVRRQPVMDNGNYPSFKGKTILLVDDNDLNREVAQTFLSKSKAQVIVAKDGQDALDKLAARRVDLVLMDCQMPIMDGFEATRVLRNNPQWQALPVIAMTANVMEGDKQRCLDAGMNDHIAKPLDIPVMFRVISHWLGVDDSIDLPQPSQSSGQWPQTPELDVEDGLNRVMNDATLYQRVLRRFYQQVPEMLEPQDDETTLRHLHTLKGLLGNIGAHSLAEVAKKAEDAAKAGADTATQLANLKVELAPLLQAIENWLPQETRGPVVSLDSDAKATLAELRPALEAADAEALDRLESFIQQHPQLRSALADLRGYLEQFDFDQALEQLDVLLEEA